MDRLHPHMSTDVLVGLVEETLIPQLGNDGDFLRSFLFSMLFPSAMPSDSF